MAESKEPGRSLVNNLAAAKGARKRRAMKIVETVSARTGMTKQAAIAELVVKGFEADPQYAEIRDEFAAAQGAAVALAHPLAAPPEGAVE